MEEKFLKEIKSIELERNNSATMFPAPVAVSSKEFYSDTELGDPQFRPNQRHDQLDPSTAMTKSRLIKKAAKKVIKTAYRPAKVIGRYMMTAIDPVILANLRSISGLNSEVQMLRARVAELEREVQISASPTEQYFYPSLPYNYKTFENNFYSFDPAKIKDKQSIYLPYLNKGGDALDVGCGEGYFMELLLDNGFKAVYGIDKNTEMVAFSKSKGLNVDEVDAITYLKEALFQGRKFSTITCFHVVEHMYPKDFFDFIRLVYACLEPGGTFVIETPNMETLAILTRGFYMDLTHVRPYPPKLLNFILKEMGFSDVKPVFSSEISNEEKLDTEVNEEKLANNFDKLNKLLYSYQDAGVVATK